MYKIFDCHTHAFPDAIAPRAMAFLSEKAGIVNHHDGTFSGLSAYERNGGASGFLLLPIATKAAQTHSVNQWAAEQTGGGVYAFGSIHPEFADFETELDFLQARGVKGVKLHPEYQDFFVDEPRLFPLYEAIFRRDMILYLHAGEDLGFPPPVRGDAERIAAVSARFPQGRIVAAHMGGFRQYDRVCRFLAGRGNVWIDTSFAAQRMEPCEAVRLVRLHGVRRVVFGTDAPWAGFYESKDAVLHSGLSPNELDDIFWNNSAALLDIRT